MPDTIAVPAVGESLGKFSLRLLLAKQGCCTTFVAVDPALNLPATVRLFEVGAGVPELRAKQQLRDHMRALMRLHHPGIVEVLDYHEGSAFAAVVLQSPPGSSLAELLKQGPLRRHRAVRVLGPVAEALEAAADAGVPHGDLNPADILIGADATARLTGLGLSPFTRPWFAAPTSDKWMPGHAAYAAPELAGAAGPDVRSDIYSFGALLYESATGQPLFKGASPADVLRKQANFPHKPASQVSPQVDAAYSAMIDKLLAKAPAQRPATWDEVITLLGHVRLRPRVAVSAPPATKVEAPPPPARDPSASSSSTSLPAIPTVSASDSVDSAEAALPLGEAPRKKVKVTYFRGQRIERAE